MSRIYLDYAATTPVVPIVFDAMTPFFMQDFGNASSLHEFGIEARKAIEHARETIATFLHVNSGSIFFTGSGTESDNMAILGAVEKKSGSPVHVITSSIEHPAVLNTCKYLESKGVDVTYIPVNQEGMIDANDVEAAIRDDTAIISIHQANNEIGTIQPVEAIGRIGREHGISFHVDAVQSFGKIPVHIKDMEVSFLSASAHKIYGPKGVGLFFAADQESIVPILHGGPQENGFRPSTENVPAIVGFGKAVEICGEIMNEESERERNVLEYLIDHVLDEINGSRLNGSRQDRLPNIANFCFDGLSGYDLVLALDREGIACSTGSACHSHSADPSHVLLALGLSKAEALSAIRVAIGRPTTLEDIDTFLEKLHQVIGELQRESSSENDTSC
ncbi:MAG TPA: cysteine desulfurase family protein [Candidatus Lokiarchaeia archaeon]|nr:cysteine desulfurase family protein [Candidatus Lokiarchaeia archaeon]